MTGLASPETCKRTRCMNPVGTRRVILVRPDGSDGKTCGPYCDRCTDLLLLNLRPVYTGGGPTYRIEMGASRA